MRTATRRLAMLALSLVTAIGAVPAAPTPIHAASGDKRPNLKMLRLNDWRVETVSGRRLLRFTTIFANAGPGRFELRGSRSSRSDQSMEMDQLMYRWDGTSRRIETPAVARYSGDGHDHWHVQGVVTYEAWKLTDPAAARRGAKTGFCFFDTTAWRLSLPYARQSPYYQQQWCGTRSAMTNRVGVSVGWGDEYPWNFAYQWIDITGLPGGIYRVRATVDIQNFYREANEFDNCVWTEIRIPAPGSHKPLEATRFGGGCGEDAMTAVGTFAGGESFDPWRNVTMDAGVHIAWQFNSQGTRLRKLWRNLSAQRNGEASAIGTPPGETGQWLYMESGPYATYWLKAGSGVHLEP
ncbi:MAG TPA: lysyl oxidase family protein [Candidatus Limnocylindria bacterium]|nr:lysyl oxidase family protein [Candidatus Limnocylindria bacterium]